MTGERRKTKSEIQIFDIRRPPYHRNRIHRRRSCSGYCRQDRCTGCHNLQGADARLYGRPRQEYAQRVFRRAGAAKGATEFQKPRKERTQRMSKEKISCERCDFCQYPRSAYDNGGCCKCKAMKRKTIDVYVGGGEAPEWCPLKNAQEKKRKGNKE